MTHDDLIVNRQLVSGRISIGGDLDKHQTAGRLNPGRLAFWYMIGRPIKKADHGFKGTN